MENDILGYYLYMEAEELKGKPKEELTESEKVNLELNPFYLGEVPTISEK